MTGKQAGSPRPDDWTEEGEAWAQAARPASKELPDLTWRIYLSCEHVYRVELAPNLRSDPVRICGACGELVSIVRAEKVTDE